MNDSKTIQNYFEFYINTYKWKLYKINKEVNLLPYIHKFKGKLKSYEPQWIYSIYLNYINDKYDISFSLKDVMNMDFKNLECEKGGEKECYILLLLIKLLLIYEQKFENFQKIDFHNTLDRLKEFEKRKVCDILFEIELKIKECEKEVLDLFHLINEDNFIYKFLTLIRKKGKYMAFWKDFAFKDIFDYNLDQYNIDIIKINNLKLTVEMYKNSENINEISKRLLKDISTILKDIYLLKEEKQNEKHFNINNSNPKTTFEIYDINNIFEENKIIKDKDLENAIINALSFIRKEKNLFEMCNRDIYILEELIYYIYNSKNNKYAYTNNIKDFINENIKIKDSNYICNAIIHTKNSNFPPKKITKYKNIKKESEKVLEKKKYLMEFASKSNKKLDKVSQLNSFLLFNTLFSK